MKRFLLDLPDEDVEQLDAIAEVERRTRQSLVRKIIADWLKEEIRKH